MMRTNTRFLKYLHKYLECVTTLLYICFVNRLLILKTKQMNVIYFIRKSDPVYDEYGYLIGHDTIKEDFFYLPDDVDANEILMNEPEDISNVRVQYIPDEVANKIGIQSK
jgi:hypothetical protein